MNAIHSEEICRVYNLFGRNTFLVPVAGDNVLSRYEGAQLIDSFSSGYREALCRNEIGVMTGRMSDGLVALQFDGPSAHAVLTGRVPRLSQTLTLTQQGQPIAFFRLVVARWRDTRLNGATFFGGNHVFRISAKAEVEQSVTIALPVAKIPFAEDGLGTDLWKALLPAYLALHFGSPTQDNGKKPNYALIAAYVAEERRIRFIPECGFALWKQGEWHPLEWEELEGVVENFLYQLVRTPGWGEVAQLLNHNSVSRVVKSMKVIARAWAETDEPPRPLI